MKTTGLVVRIGLFLCFAAMVWAQATSQIQGTVQDATGAAVPGAEIKVTQTETGATRTVSTGGDGGYVLPNLPTGPYRMEITKAGFSKYIQTGIVLQVAVNPTIDVALKVGAVSDQVQVEANATQVETQATGIGAVIESQRIVELPLNGRNSTDLVQLSAGSVFVAPPVSRSFGGSSGGQAIAVAGGQYFSTSYFLDGANHNNPYDNLNLPLPFPDALQEFKVETSALTAQNGVHSGAAVNAVTKGGTNDFHGDLFYFVRNAQFNARNFFAATRDQLKRNQYGGTVGGPIKKDKLFFFFGYQGTKTRSSVQAAPAFVPTAAMLTGDFSGCATVTTLKNPVTGAVIPSKIMPSNLISPAALKIAAKLPKAQNACGTFNYATPLNQDEYQMVSRVDYQLSAKQTLFGRYMATALTQAIPFTVTPDNILVTVTGGRDNLAQSATFGDTYLLNSTMVNSFRAAFNRTAIRRSNAPDFGPQDVGINAYSYTPDNFLLSVTGGFSIGGGTESNSSFHTTTYQLNDDFNIVHGAHQFAFGVAGAKWPSESLANVRSPGIYTFGSTATGYALADFLTGRLNNIDQAAPNNLFMKQWYMGAYAQDTWKVSSRLTANIGVRWEPWFPPSVTNNAIYNFDLNRFNQGIKSTIYSTPSAPPGFQYPGDPGFPGQSGANKKWADFSPRIGVAWDPSGNGKTVVRASFGIAYDFTDGQQNLNTAIAPPFGDEVRPTPSPTIDGLTNPYQGFPGGNPFPISFDPKNALYVPFGPFLTTPYNLATPTVNMWNLTIQRQVRSWVLSGSYVGSQTSHLLLTEALNSPVFIPGNCLAGQYGLTAPGPCSSTSNYNSRRPLFLAKPTTGGQFIGYMDQFNAGGTQSYNGMILSAARPLIKGVTANVNYTWSHCISDDRWGAGGTTQNVAQTVLNPFDFGYDRGDCNFDKRHIANFTLVAQTPKFANRGLRMIASGWQMAWIVRYQSGVALTAILPATTDRQLTNVSGQRPNQLSADVYSSSAACPATVAPCVGLLNPAAFGLPALGTLGNMSPGSIRGPGFTDISMSLSRTFPITERIKLDIRGDAFNLPNSFRAGCNGGANCSGVNLPGFGGFVGNSFGTPTFGRITSAMDPRIIQLAGKIIF